jgi:histidinol-phosphate aminotransferase
VEIKSITRDCILNLESREYAPEKKENGKHDLSLNINPYGVSERVLSRLKNLSKETISHYYPKNSIFLEKIAEYVGATPKQILLGDGCDGCLELIAHTFIDKGNEVLIPTPTFHRYEFHTRLMGGKPVFVPMDNFVLDAEAVLNKATSKTKVIFLCNPNNPTGIKIEMKTKEKIISNFNGIVVIDEALADSAGVNGSDLTKKYNNLIIVRSFSKTFGLASLRIGYIVSNEDIIKQVEKSSSPFKVNGVAQELALEALNDKKHIEKSIMYMKKERDFMFRKLEELGLEHTDSTTNNFLVDISPTGLSPAKLVDELKRKNIIVTNAKSFMLPEDKYIRVSISNEESNRAFIKAIETLIKAQ